MVLLEKPLLHFGIKHLHGSLCGLECMRERDIAIVFYFCAIVAVCARPWAHLCVAGCVFVPMCNSYRRSNSLLAHRGPALEDIIVAAINYGMHAMGTANRCMHLALYTIQAVHSGVWIHIQCQ
jgi:hypothetical protein